MAIVKPTKSGKAIIFIDDFGNSYITSKSYVLSLLGGRMRAPFIQLNRLPMPQAPDKFKSSPLLGKDWEEIEEGQEGWRPPQCSHNVDVAIRNNEGMSKKTMKEREKEEALKDVDMEW